MMTNYLFEMSRKIKEKFGDKVERIVLFGSYARGDYSAESDIDILVVVRDDSIENDIRKVIYSFIPITKRLISVKILRIDRYTKMKEMNLSFIRSVEREGIVIG
jgi:predicted nucleotidyltransferase